MLFEEQDLNAYKLHIQQCVRDAVRQIPPQAILGNSEDELSRRIAEQHRVRVPQLLDEGEIVRHEMEVPVVSTRTGGTGGLDEGTQFQIDITFVGHSHLFNVSAADKRPGVKGSIARYPDRVQLAYSFVTPDGDELQRSVACDIDLIKQRLAELTSLMLPFNDEIEALARSEIRARKNVLQASYAAIEAIGIPIRRRSDVPSTYEVPLQLRPSPARRLKEASFQPSEPTLQFAEYEHILSIIRNMVKVMERSPGAFATMDEESLRTHFLVQLNGQYEGQATGETFNYNGKTDILIRADGENLFIAECKFWTGEAAFYQTITQLLGYLTWRDTKTAVIIFNRNVGFSAMLDTVYSAVAKHCNYVRCDSKIDETTVRCIFSLPHDAVRHIYLTVMVFDIPRNK